MIDLKIPIELSNLPVLKTLPQINLKEDFVLTASTGSGKTTLIPAFISHNERRIVILRQPTRKLAYMIYKTLSDFYVGQLTVGIITSEEKNLDYRLINSYNIIVVTDGVITSIIKKLDLSRTTFIFDEIHWMMSATEIELSLVQQYKLSNPSLQIVLLSATIDPYLLVNYFEKNSNNPIPDTTLRDICNKSNSESINNILQPQKLKVYYSEGIAFPIEHHIVKVADINEIDDQITLFCNEMKTIKDKGIVFLSTRNEIKTAQEKYNYILPTFYCHADTPVEDLMRFLNNPNAGVVFATIALATSATLPLFGSMIIDKSNDSGYNDILQQKYSKYGVNCDYNEIKQKEGRIGRTRPGKVYLVTTRNISWEDIKPTNIIPPLKKELPINAALVASSHNIDLGKVNLLSDLSKKQIDNSYSKLKSMKFVDENNVITTLGKRALNLPLEPEDAKIMLSTPTSFIPATAAYLSFSSGMFYVIDKKNNDLINNYTYNSIPITKIRIMQDALTNKSRLKQWCKEYDVNYKRMGMSMYNFHQIGLKFGMEASEIDDKLLSIDLESPHLFTAYKMLIYALMPKYSVYIDGKGFNININGYSYFSFFGDPDFFTCDGIVKASGKFSLFQSSKGHIFGRINDSTINIANENLIQGI